METLPAWHTALWAQLNARRASGRLPHALLLHGVEGLGKADFAKRLGQALLCSQSDDSGLPCGMCHACQMFAAGTHPDFQWLEPEEKGKAIRVDAVRSLCRHLALKSQFGRHKVAVLVPADRMNIAAANALLKTLEEPSASTMLVLITARPAYLPATIRSRCQSLAFLTPDQETAMAWLQAKGVQDGETLLGIAQGAPLLAAQLANTDCVAQRQQLLRNLEEIRSRVTDPVRVAANYLSNDPAELCRWMLSYVMDMIRLRWADQPPRLVNPDLVEALRHLASGIGMRELFELQDSLVAAQRQLETSVNTQLLLEELFLRWAAVDSQDLRQAATRR